MHWHPNADEWQCYVSGQGANDPPLAMLAPELWVLNRVMWGYVLQSTPHYIENTGETDLVFLEMFKSAHYEDISLGEWMAHTPHLLVNQHLRVGRAMLDVIPKGQMVIVPA